MPKQQLAPGFATPEEMPALRNLLNTVVKLGRQKSSPGKNARDKAIADFLEWNPPRKFWRM
jgi:hypothetical protein